MAELEDIQNMQGAVASTPALMDMSVPAEAGAVNINPEWVVFCKCERVCKYCVCLSDVYCYVLAQDFLCKEREKQLYYIFTDLMRLCIYCIIIFKRKMYVIYEVKREKLNAVRVYVYDRKTMYEVCVFLW